jgi:hypothetical protein
MSASGPSRHVVQRRVSVAFGSKADSRNVQLVSSPTRCPDGTHSAASRRLHERMPRRAPSYCHAALGRPPQKITRVSRGDPFAPSLHRSTSWVSWRIRGSRGSEGPAGRQRSRNPHGGPAESGYPEQHSLWMTCTGVPEARSSRTCPSKTTMGSSDAPKTRSLPWSTDATRVHLSFLACLGLHGGPVVRHNYLFRVS